MGNSASSLALACTSVQVSLVSLSKAGLSCLYQCPSFAVVSRIAETLNVRGRGAGGAGIAAKPAEMHSANKRWFHLSQGNDPSELVWKSNWSNQYTLGKRWCRDVKQPPGLSKWWRIETFMYLCVSLCRQMLLVCRNAMSELFPITSF